MPDLQVAGPIKAVIIRTWDDGRVQVVDAPRLAEFSTDVLANLDPMICAVDDAGFLDIGAGQAVYRPVAFRHDLSGRLTLICERVH